jgi:hypothetical protein
MFISTFIPVALLLLTFIPNLTGIKRSIEPWPYDKLFKKAELVVIARAISHRDVTPEDKIVSPKGMEAHFVGVITGFQVHHLLKGELKQKTLDLFHFRLKEGIQIANGPLLVSFKVQPIKDRGESFAEWAMPAYGGPPHYMLFLMKRADGRFECISGQIDPFLSVMRLNKAP